MEDLRQDVRKDPADLEREADSARGAVEDTLHELERQLSPSQLVHRVIDAIKRNGGGFAEDLAAQVRNNPLPALLAGVGVVWLVLAPKRAEQPSVDNPAARSAMNPASRTASATGHAAEALAQASRGGVQRVTEGYSYLSRQPLVVGALAVVVGATIGALLPSSDAEDEWIGELSEEAKSRLESEARGNR